MYIYILIVLLIIFIILTVYFYNKNIENQDRNNNLSDKLSDEIEKTSNEIDVMSINDPNLMNKIIELETKLAIFDILFPTSNTTVPTNYAQNNDRSRPTPTPRPTSNPQGKLTGKERATQAKEQARAKLTEVKQKVEELKRTNEMYSKLGKQSLEINLTTLLSSCNTPLNLNLEGDNKKNYYVDIITQKDEQGEFVISDLDITSIKNQIVDLYGNIEGLDNLLKNITREQLKEIINKNYNKICRV